MIHIVLLCALLLTSCYTLPDRGRPIDLDALATLKVKQSTQNDVRELFGEPQTIITKETERGITTAWQYMHIVFSTENPVSETLTLAFDESGTLLEITRMKF